MSLTTPIPESDWIRSPNPPPYCSSKMYFFENWADRLGFNDNGKLYYRLNCTYWFGDWIEEQDKDLWRAEGLPHRAIYVVREDLMTLIKLKWT